jgi:dUTP pyrophosphatase
VTTTENHAMIVKRIGDHHLEPPKRATEGAAAFDLQAVEWVTIYPGQRLAIATGWAWEIPAGNCGLVLPRSGLAAKHGITVLNAPGLIDSDYRGEVKALLINLGDEPFEIQPSDRIAQLLVQQTGWGAGGRCIEVEELSDTARGAGGFGSTGVKA